MSASMTFVIGTFDSISKCQALSFTYNEQNLIHIKIFHTFHLGYLYLIFLGREMRLAKIQLMERFRKTIQKMLITLSQNMITTITMTIIKKNTTLNCQQQKLKNVTKLGISMGQFLRSFKEAHTENFLITCIVN